MRVKLNEIIEALDGVSEGHAFYLDKRTGEIVLVTDEEMQAAEDDDPISEYPDWQQESVLKARELLREPDHFLPLPEQFDINEYGLMEEFCLSLKNREIGERLGRLIKGSGAFRRFKNAIRELAVSEAWYEFRSKTLERIAIEWLEENQIEYSRDDEPAVPSQSVM